MWCRGRVHHPRLWRDSILWPDGKRIISISSVRAHEQREPYLSISLRIFHVRGGDLEWEEMSRFSCWIAFEYRKHPIAFPKGSRRKYKYLEWRARVFRYTGRKKLILSIVLNLCQGMMRDSSMGNGKRWKGYFIISIHIHRIVDCTEVSGQPRMG